MNPMIDIWILFASYFISVISLGIALYCAVRVTELTELLQRTKQEKPKYDVKTYKPSTPKRHNWS